MGDRIGDIKAGAEASKDYVFDFNQDWNEANTYVYALAIDSEGFVNNMNICSIKGNSDYNRR
jgi:hypothetical protein